MNRGRPKGKTSSSKVVYARLTEAELALFQALCAERGVTVTQLLKSLILGELGVKNVKN